MAISTRMAEALAEWRTAKNLFREARAQFNTAVDAHRDDEVWSEELRQGIATLRSSMEVAKRGWIKSDEGIRRAKLYDRMEWLHGNGKEPIYD